jgi:mannose-6-phosphate isomerase-like protein (cupin superfamily)
VKKLAIDDVEGLPVLGTLTWKPIRKTLGITAFGTNAYTAVNAGDEVVEEHTEETYGHEEMYVVLRGHATFTVDGEEVDAPQGTIVFLDDPKQQRHAVAKEAGTTVLAVGGKAGVHEVSPWEYYFPALPALNAGDYDTARTILEDALRELDHSAIRYNLACLEARAGNGDRALELLATTNERHRGLAADDEDFASLRDDARFRALTGEA